MPSKICSSRPAPPKTPLSAGWAAWICAAIWIASSVAASASDPVTSDPTSVDSRFPSSMAEVTLKSHGSRIHGIVYQAQGRGPHPTVVLLHGFPGNEKNLDVAQAIRRAGFNVVFFHYRGSWGSEGDFSFSHGLQDVAAVLAHLRTPEAAERHRIDPKKLALIGHSMGGFMALRATADDPGVACVASIAGVSLGVWGEIASGDPQASKAVAEALDGGTGPLSGTSGIALRDELLKRRKAFDLFAVAPALKDRPVLLIGGSRDSVVPMAGHHDPMVQALKNVGAESLSTQVLDADHAFSDKRIALTRGIVQWLEGACR